MSPVKEVGTIVQVGNTRNVIAISEQLCGTRVCKVLVSQAAQMLDEELEVWHHRPLGNVTYLFLVARFEKVQQGDKFRTAAILMANLIK